jgi:hypothetical protein
MRLAAVAAVALTVGLAAVPASATLAPADPPLAHSSNVHLLGRVPGSAAGMNFTGHYAYVTGWSGVQVLDIKRPASPQLVGEMPLPHFENEDVDLCGNKLIVVNDREAKDLGSILYVVSIADRTKPRIVGVLPLGLTGSGRGSGHIANFVTRDCKRLWVDGGDHVEVVDVSTPSKPRSLGKFKSAASKSKEFEVSHDTERDSSGMVWNVGGGGAAAYRLTRKPLKPHLVATTGKAGRNLSKYNDFILHNSQRRGKTLLVTEEDYIDQDETPPGGCRGQGKFEAWSLSKLKKGRITPSDTWQTELNGMLTRGAVDSKAPVTVNCSSHWFDARKGVAAVGWYEQGTRFISYRKRGHLRQVGYYIPANGSTWAAYWSPTDKRGQVAYTADVYRGIDVLRIDGGGRRAKSTRAPVPAKWLGGAKPASIFAPHPVFGMACPLLAARS